MTVVELEQLYVRYCLLFGRPEFKDWLRRVKKKHTITLK